MTAQSAGQLTRGGPAAPGVLAGRWSPAVAPGGDRVAFVSDAGGQPQVWLAPADGAPAILVDAGPHPVLRVSWSPDGAWLAVLVAPGGAPRTEIWLVRPDGSGLHQVAGFGSWTACPGSWLPGGARLAVTEIGAGGSQVVLLDAAAGTRRVLVGGELLSALDVSRDGRLVLLRQGPRGRRTLAVAELATGRCRPLPAGTGDGCTELGCFSADGSVVYARTDAGREFAALVAIPVAPDGAGPRLLAEWPGAELEQLALSPDGGTLALTWNVDGGRSALTLLDPVTGAARPVAPLPGTVVTDCGFGADGHTLAITAEAPDQPRDVWLVDLATGAATPAGLPAEPADAVPPAGPARTGPAPGPGPQLRRLHSADGLEITGWLHRPAGAGPWPTVIHLHGGPEAQERPGYNPLFRALTAQGIAVFAPNVRGSSGFGRSFVTADDLAGRYGAIADVAACAAHLVQSGVAEPGRIGCMGRSYGGYLTLAALVTYPELFAVGVDICGMADFATFFARTEPWIAAAAVTKYGHPEHDRELLHDLSPLHRFDRVVAPLLVVHGGNDSNVPVYEAEQVVAAAAARGLPHRYLLFPDEGHELLDPANRSRFVRETADWLAAHLGVSAPGAPVPAGVAVPAISR